MALSDAGKAALVYWGEIQAGVSARASTADIWQAIRGAAAEAGLDSPGVTLQGVNEIRSAAARIRNTADTFGAARELESRTGLAQSIESGQIAYAPWSRPAEQIATLAKYQVRFEYQTISESGQTDTTWLTALFPGGQLPDTTGDLIDALGTFGLSSGSPPSGDFAGIGRVELIAV